MSDTARTQQLAELSEPYWMDSPVLRHGLSACACDLPEPPRNRVGALRSTLVGLAGGLVVLGLAVTLMT
ncbi:MULTISPECIES: hypothetical protein [unclassified Streptomyces]|uniref:hypothetical protein n=1 Tax=unclassified Streptomyces TaxID=2593676 RepID=UPI002E18295F|nr:MULTISPECIES: hypothetical protein [unclassified Streptomyces]